MDTQAEIDVEIAEHAAGPAGRPLLDYGPYRSSSRRHPMQAPVQAHPEGVELWAPCFGERDVAASDADLTAQHDGEPIGERIVVTGTVRDGDGRPVAGQLIEIWQANASGRYRHPADRHRAPLDPNFTGLGRTLTGPDGGYTFLTIKPGPYPWRNHLNAWRPAHIHFSLFGTVFAERLVTQMYFPGDPLFSRDPILQSVTDPNARSGLVAAYDHDATRAEYATGYRWDIVLSGAGRTWHESDSEQPA